MFELRQRASYVDRQRFTGSTASGLALQIVHAAPKDATQREKEALEEIKAAGHEITRVNNARSRVISGTVRPALIALNGAWTGAYEIASGKARISAEISDIGGKAEQILSGIFSDGVPVSQSTALEAWTASTALLERMDEEKLGKTFEVVVGKDVLTHIRKTTRELGEEIGTDGEMPDAPSSTALQEALARFGLAVALYCRQLIASLDERDPKSVERFLKAVAPIDRYREAMYGGSQADTADTTSEPQPATTAQPSATPTDGVANGVGHDDTSHA